MNVENINEELLKNIITIIDVATERGAVRGQELLAWAITRRTLEEALNPPVDEAVEAVGEIVDD